jgi:3-oxoacyl-[acyl-carrier protein] reductase
MTTSAQHQRPATGALHSPFRLDDQVAVVTGATGGLGAAIARSLADAGARVVLAYLGAAPTPEVLDDIAERSGLQPIAVEADVVDASSLQALASTVVDQMGAIDVLVNNAGILEQAAILDTSAQSWARVLDVNLTGTFLAAKTVVPQMLKQQSGAIINVASQLAFKGAVETSAYTASKAGIIGLTRTMARELGPTIRVNAIAPGPIATAMNDPYADADWISQRTNGLVMKRLATAEEVAPGVVFLATAAGVLMHGQTLHLNGGGVMQ